MTDARFDRVKLLLKETGLEKLQAATVMVLSLIHISEPTRPY